MTRPAYVYRAFADDGRLLYVGSTVDVDSRMRYHAQHAPWYPFHVRVETEEHPTLAAARDAETAAILAEHPRWNVVGRDPQHPEGFISQARGRFAASWLRADIAAWRRWLHGEPVQP